MSTTITTGLNTLWANKSAIDRLVQGKAQLQNAYNVLKETNAAVQKVVDAGAFTGVPADILAALNAAWIATKACQAAMEVATVAEALNWAGTPIN
jgi:hypothetical protein